MANRRRGTKRTIFSDAECKTIATIYDGTTATLNKLMARYKARKAKRHNIITAAARGGYESTRVRKAWTAAEDDWIRENWHKRSPDEVAKHLGRSVTSVTLRKKRIGVSRYDGPDYTVLDLERLLRIDHRQWHDFIERGWLKAWQRGRQHGAAPITYVSVPNLLACLRDHPEIVDYREATPYVSGVLEFAKLPDPPKYKQVRCDSRSFTDTVKATPHGLAAHDEDVRLIDKQHRYSIASCADTGGFHFFAPLYDAAPRCPRCGCIVSRYAPDGLYSDSDEEGAVLHMLADKLGLRFDGENFLDGEGQPIDNVDLLRYAFNTNRTPERAARIFGKLLDRGLVLPPSAPIPPARVLPNVLRYELTPMQEDDFHQFLACGAVNVERWPGYGKRYLGAMALTRLAGRHLLMVDMRAVRDQWIEHFEQFAHGARIRRKHKPASTEITIFEPSGEVRCVIDLFSYASRYDFDGRSYVMALFDESHRLPSNRAHRHALIPIEFRMGGSASAFREDARDGWIRKLTGAPIGNEWQAHVESGTVPRVPIRVLIVKDVAHKYRVANLLTAGRRALVFCEALKDGEWMRERYGMPFVSSATKAPLKVIAAHRRVAVSRTCDTGIDVPDLEVVVDLSFLGGSRAQSVQRFGRLLHSKAGQLEHVILMTETEYEKRIRRVQVLEQKGFTVAVARAAEVPEQPPNRTACDPAANWRLLFGRAA